MPKAAIHEYGETFPSENEIGIADDALPPAPARDPSLAKELNELDFGAQIPVRTDLRHDV